MMNDSNTVSCDGDGTHPLIYLDMSTGSAVCPYCSKKFEQKDTKHS